MMQRRNFLQKCSSWITAISLGAGMSYPVRKFADSGVLNAYYFRSTNPENIRRDLAWLKGFGVNAITLGILEADISSYAKSLDLVFREAMDQGMAVYLIPTRWCGIFAGGAKVGSIFASSHPHTWGLKADGKPAFNTQTGVYSSFHYPEVGDFIVETFGKALKRWPIKGLIWDEPKIWGRDYTPLALEKLGKDAPMSAHHAEAVSFLNQLGTRLRTHQDNLELIYVGGTDTTPDLLKAQAALQGLHYFACSGLPWPQKVNSGKTDYEARYLPDKGAEYQAFAAAMHCKSMLVIKNVSIAPDDFGILDEHLPEVIRLRPDHLFFYAFPPNIDEPLTQMNILAKQLVKFRS
jgi:hypothetical protein